MIHGAPVTDAYVSTRGLRQRFYGKLEPLVASEGLVLPDVLELPGGAPADLAHKSCTVWFPGNDDRDEERGRNRARVSEDVEVRLTWKVNANQQRVSFDALLDLERVLRNTLTDYVWYREFGVVTYTGVVRERHPSNAEWLRVTMSLVVDRYIDLNRC